MNDQAFYELFASIIGHHIRAKREQKGLTREEAAWQADVDANSLGKNERGERIPEAVTLYKLQRVLDIRVDKIFAVVAAKDDRHNSHSDT